MVLENVFLKSYGALRTFMKNNPPLKNPSPRSHLLAKEKSLYPNGELGFIR
jgi:dihydroorotase-like cyclic amidohydrolase